MAWEVAQIAGRGEREMGRNGHGRSTAQALPPDLPLPWQLPAPYPIPLRKFPGSQKQQGVGGGGGGSVSRRCSQKEKAEKSHSTHGF